MGSKIVFLGTGGDHFVVGKQSLASGGVILRVDENQFHIDPGPGAVVRARQYSINLRENTALFVTHNHINHCNDVNAVIDAMTYSGLDRQGVFVGNKTVISGADGYDPYLTRFHRECVERTILLEPDQRLGINDVEIRATKALHSEPNTIGLKFFTPKFTLGYTSDTDFRQEIAKQYREIDVLILNVKHPTEMKKEFHLCSDDAIKFLKTAKPKLAIITHFGIKMLKQDPIAEARRIQKESGCQVIAAKDGMAVDPVSYSANLRTKTLNLY